ncbi:hypothetical protein [Corynebacterium meridianum]|uniref:Uncharacterized protein n=1 Tax=Corynebacterium meridianum TaxID=2765363 RepID=A0A934I6R9_9CORY|nr:hypothetical protein [Corynebacterium meridianum]MBI8989387.1 hypothetical protein [Corynebacterium meridianum]MCK7677019.1 hypothetical protein [Corynebacterium meridianum]
MIQFVVGAAAGYVFGTKAGRKRYHQLKKGYTMAVESPVARAAVTATRKAVANKLDPEPRMKEVKDLRRGTTESGQTILEPDED